MGGNPAKLKEINAMKINHDLINKLFGKSKRSIRYMLDTHQLTQQELLEFSLFVASISVPSGGILSSTLMESIQWGLQAGHISGLNPALQGLQLSHTTREIRVSETAKRKASKAGLHGDEILELAYLIAMGDETFFDTLRARLELDWPQKTWAREELVAQLTHKSGDFPDPDDDDGEQSPPTKIH